MSGPGRVLRRLSAISAPPWGRLGLAAVAGVAGVGATIWLMAGSGYVVTRAAEHPGLGALAGVLALVEVAAFLRAPIRYADRLVAHDAAFRALAGWRVWLFDRVEPLVPAGLPGWRTGDVLRRCVDDVDALQDLYLRAAVPAAVAVAGGALGTVVVGLLVPVAAVPLGIGLVLALVGAPALALTTRHLAQHESAARAEQAAETVDLVQGMADLVAFDHAPRVLARLDELEARLRHAQRRRAFVGGAGGALVNLAVGVAVVGTLVATVGAVHDHRLAPVMVAVVPLVALGAFEAVPPVLMVALHLGDVVAAGRRLLALDEVPPPVRDPARPAAPPQRPAGGGGLAVELRGATLRYGPGRPLALDHVDLVAPAGRRTAVVGPSGAGKSSVVNALLRFWPLEAGTAAIGGVDLATLAQRDGRALVALVDEDAHLFTGTLRHNVTLGRPLDEAVLADALDRAQLRGWIATLPEGLDTPVGELGARVSVGQQRRIALARALCADAPVLLLDEPTAGLDAETAARLVADVLGPPARGAAPGPAGPTVLLITHRAEDAVGVDQVVALDHGRVVPGDADPARAARADKVD